MNLTKPNQEKYWYAVFTKPRSEKKVLERMLDNDIEAFLPLIKTVRQWSDRKKTVHLPLIPSYVFVKIEEKDLYKTLPIPGTVNVLKHLGKPAKIKEFEIENLKILCNSDEKIEVSNNMRVVIGDAVEVTNGPFMGLIAICEKTSGSHRVVVKIESLGNGFNVNIPLSFLRKIKAKPQKVKEK